MAILNDTVYVRTSTAWVKVGKGSSDFIQNQNDSSQTANFNISGLGRVRNGMYVSAPSGIISSSLRTGATQLPQLQIGIVNASDSTSTYTMKVGGWHTSTFAGVNAMNNGVGAAQSAAFGYHALELNTTGNNNSAFGAFALEELTTGYIVTGKQIGRAHV